MFQPNGNFYRELYRAKTWQAAVSAFGVVLSWTGSSWFTFQSSFIGVRNELYLLGGELDRYLT